MGRALLWAGLRIGAAVVTPDATGLLPEGVTRELLVRWAEPHRHYHGVTHLRYGLEALDMLGGSRVEQIAFWFHDAVHSNSTPQDEEASAELMSHLLAGHERAQVIAEIQRLVLLTAGHHTEADDHAGQRLCDADLSGLGADDAAYRRNVAGIRAEMPHLTDEQWRLGRSAFLSRFLQRRYVFATGTGRTLWESRARRNLENELQELQSGLRQQEAGNLS